MKWWTPLLQLPASGFFGLIGYRLALRGEALAGAAVCGFFSATAAINVWVSWRLFRDRASRPGGE